MSKVLTFTKGELLGKNLDDFYEYVGRQLDEYTAEMMFDCKKINISKDIQDCIYESYHALYPDLYQRNPTEFNTQVTMLLAIKGPKVSIALNSFEVELEDGFLFKENVGYEDR